MIGRALLSLGLLAAPAPAFVAPPPTARRPLRMAAESEVSFSDLDGSSVRIGVLRTRWNDEHVANLVEGIKAGAKECKVADANIFVKEVPGCYELPYAAKLLAMSGTVDAIVCCGVLIKGDTMHFEYISDAVSRGIMNVNVATMTPVVYGVLNCLDEGQVRKRSSGEDGGHNHGEDWGKTAVEMAIMRREASGKGVGKVKELEAMGFQMAEAAKSGAADKPGVADKPGFF